MEKKLRYVADGDKVWFLIVPYALFTLAFGGSVVPKLNLYDGPTILLTYLSTSD